MRESKQMRQLPRAVWRGSISEQQGVQQVNSRRRQTRVAMGPTKAAAARTPSTLTRWRAKALYHADTIQGLINFPFVCNSHLSQPNPS